MLIVMGIGILIHVSQNIIILILLQVWLFVFILKGLVIS
jgi:hypothetical protein